MKTKMIMLLLAVAGFLSCTKPEKGDNGPAGPAGPAGNANVKSKLYSVTSGNWILNASNEYEATIGVPEITQDILDKGTVQVFDVTGGIYTMLPASYANTEINVDVKIGTVIVNVGDATGAAISNPGSSTFKIATIAGTIKKPINQ